MKFVLTIVALLSGAEVFAGGYGSVTMDIIELLESGRVRGRLYASAYSPTIENSVIGRTSEVFASGTIVNVEGLSQSCQDFALAMMTSDRNLSLLITGEMDFGYQYDPQLIKFGYPTTPVRCVLKR